MQYAARHAPVVEGLALRIVVGRVQPLSLVEENIALVWVDGVYNYYVNVWSLVKQTMMVSAPKYNRRYTLMSTIATRITKAARFKADGKPAGFANLGRIIPCSSRSIGKYLVSQLNRLKAQNRKKGGKHQNLHEENDNNIACLFPPQSVSCLPSVVTRHCRDHLRIVCREATSHFNYVARKQVPRVERI